MVPLKPIHIGLMKACCANPANRSPWQRAPERIADSVSICLRCGCRHFHLNAEPGKIGLRLG
jgi:radical SAM superfamily enzyme with C-terminal helix-hairpin-helix motif